MNGIPVWCVLTAMLALPVSAAEPDGVLALVEQAASKAQQLGAKLAACRQRGEDIAVPDAALATAELLGRFSRSDAQDAKLRDAAATSMRYVLAMLDEELALADQVAAGRAHYPRVPQWNTVGVKPRDGGFYVGDEPVFLSGMNWDAGTADGEPELARRLGINLVDTSLRGSLRPDGTWDLGEYRGSFGPYLQRMGQRGFAVDALLDTSPPGWMIAAEPGLARRGYGHYDGFVFEHPKAAAYRAGLLDQLMPLAAREKALFAIDLTNEPAYQQSSELMLANWRAWLERRYGTVAALNAAWGTSHAAFAAVDRYPSMVADSKDAWARAAVDFTKPGVRGAYYDWCAFNNERVSDYFASIARRIKQHAPDVAVHVKVMMGLYFTGGTEPRGWPMSLTYQTFGVDPEAIAGFADILGGDIGLVDLMRATKLNRFTGSVPYAMEWLNNGLASDFLRSLAPRQPFYNSEFHAIEPIDATVIEPSEREHIETALWLAHLHGMAGDLTWFWGRKADGSVMDMAREWFAGSLLGQPWALRGYCQETLRLRRFVQPIMAFWQTPRAVRLLYSEPSAIQDTAYVDALRDCYEALNYLGVPIGLVTEKQLQAGLDRDTRLLIVPNAAYVADETLAALRRCRAQVALIGPDSLSRVPTGGPRADHALAAARQAPLGTPRSYHPVLRRWLAAAGIKPELTAADAQGQPAWGIETRTARLGRQRLFYLVNELREPVTVRLDWTVADARPRDQRADQALGSTVTLRPRQVVFGEY